MTIYYSASQKGFFDSAINAAIPSDAVEISSEYRWELVNGQSEGKIIEADKDGYPYLAEPPPPTDEQLLALCKSEAQSRLQETDYSELPTVRASLENADEFDAYRVAVRALLIEPVTHPEFPEAPKAQWAKP